MSTSSVPVRLRGRSVRFRRAGALTLAGAAGALLTVALPATALASYANSDYQGYSSSEPSGYNPAPQGWTVGDDITYDFSVMNTSNLMGQPTGAFYVQRITAVDGQSVASGYPAFSEQDVTQHATAADPPVQIEGLDQSHPMLIGGSQDQAYDFTPSRCGYYVLWTGSTSDRNDQGDILNQGVTRVTGCSGPQSSPSASPTRSPQPRGTHLVVPPPRTTPAATASPSPSPKPSPHPKKKQQSGPLPVGSVDTSGGGGPAVVGTLLDDRSPKGISANSLLIGAGAIAVAAAMAAAWLLRDRLPQRLRRAVFQGR